MVFINVCQIGGEILSPIGTLLYKYEALSKYGRMPQYFFELSDSLSEWNASVRSNTERALHLELPNIQTCPLPMGMASCS